jgi:hypothetical protein
MVVEVEVLEEDNGHVVNDAVLVMQYSVVLSYVEPAATD